MKIVQSIFSIPILIELLNDYMYRYLFNPSKTLIGGFWRMIVEVFHVIYHIIFAVVIGISFHWCVIAPMCVMLARIGIILDDDNHELYDFAVANRFTALKIGKAPSLDDITFNKTWVSSKKVILLYKLSL